MKVSFSVVVLSLLASLAFALPPEVAPQMIEISMDGADYVEASSYISDIAISTGTAPTENVTVVIARGVVMAWVIQLGTPHEEEMCKWKLDTGLLPAAVQKFTLRFRWVHGVAESPRSVPSSEMTIIEAGQPGKPTVIILN